jgi:hypothetical protein
MLGLLTGVLERLRGGKLVAGKSFGCGEEGE